MKLGVVGLNMGRSHCLSFVHSGRFQLDAVCDCDPARLAAVAVEAGASRVYSDYHEMLQRESLDAVVIATPTELHAPMTMLAAVSGVRGIYCEKPMAVSSLEARTMQAVCDRMGCKLMIGHQRRRSPAFITMKKEMDAGTIGDVVRIRGTCPGDMLSDGTHTVDTIRYLLGDADPEWILGALHRFPHGTPLWGDHVFTGRRYGHSIESGMHILMSMAGVRVEILTGSLWEPGCGYQDIEVFGAKGSLRRAGDAADPALVLSAGGASRSVAIPLVQTMDAAWKADSHGVSMAGRSVVADEFADFVLTGGPHGMEGSNALKTHEIVMAAHESARLRQRLNFPLLQDRYPLDMMLEDGWIR
jgi:predicted dehydrogenase